MTTADTPATGRTNASHSYMIGVACAVGTAFFLSGNNTALAVYYDFGGTIPAMLFLRYLFYVLAVGLVCRMAGSALRLAEGEHGGVVLIGSIYTVGMMSLLTAFTLIPVSLAVLVLYTFPIITTIIKAVLDRQLPGLMFLACLVVALIGLAVALEVHDLVYDPLGIVVASVASLAFAVTFALNERWYPHIEPMAFSFHMSVPGLAIVTLVYVGYFLAMNIGSPRALEYGLPELGSAGSYAIALSVVYYTIAILLMFRAIQAISAPRTAMIMNLEPIFTLAMVMVFLGSPLNPFHLAGAAIVIAAVLGAQFSNGPRQHALTASRGVG